MTDISAKKLTLEDLATKDPLTDESLMALTDAQILELVRSVVHNDSILNRECFFTLIYQQVTNLNYRRSSGRP